MFFFYHRCLRAFELIKEKLVSTPIVVVPDWTEPLEIIYDASDYTVTVVLGQRREKIFMAIYYSSRILNDA